MPFLFLLAKLAQKNAAASNSIPTALHRKRPGMQVTLQCPECNLIGPATEIFQEERTANSDKWLPDRRLYECNACKYEMNPDHFAKNDRGFLQAKTAPCPFCQTPNPATCVACRWCQKRIV